MRSGCDPPGSLIENVGTAVYEGLDPAQEQIESNNPDGESVSHTCQEKGRQLWKRASLRHDYHEDSSEYGTDHQVHKECIQQRYSVIGNQSGRSLLDGGVNTQQLQRVESHDGCSDHVRDELDQTPEKTGGQSDSREI